MLPALLTALFPLMASPFSAETLAVLTNGGVWPSCDGFGTATTLAVSLNVLLAFAAKASIENGQLLLRSGARQLALPLSEIATAKLWWLPLPGPGLSLQLTSGARWRYALALRNPATLARALGTNDNNSTPAKVYPPRATSG